MSYFLDSYAIIEILEGNINYQKYSEISFITTKLNLFEVSLYLLRSKKPLDFIKSAYGSTVDFDENVILFAARFKISHPGVSMADSIGYVVSISASHVFLTGDKAFKGLPNVEFVI